DSPRTLAAEPPTSLDHDEELPDPAMSGRKNVQEEDAEDKSEEREHDIYSQKVIACSIENKEACLMCSG
ncbi:hypothetical protein L6232_25020, partial [Shewanella sp. C31]|nr:hypothetical protein [Shewanella electrica]